MLPLHKHTVPGIALAMIAVGHLGGWPFPQGGAQELSNALASYLRSLGGEISTGVRVRNLRELPESKAILLDVSPRQVLEIAGQDLPPMYAKVLDSFKYGLGAFKVDWALSEAVPWRSSELKRTATIHLGATMDEIAHSEREAWFGRTGDKPFIIAAQHSLFDRTRAPEGKHTLWGYCHVPNGSNVDMLDRIEGQIERFAPGFRDCVLARTVSPPRQLESMDANLVGGDIAAGRQDFWQMVSRPSVRYWATPLKHLFICSASTPPGAGVHGMCGYFAAQLALKRRFGLLTQQLFSEVA
jgi:phytoene dehydrogenase-like protein